MDFVLLHPSHITWHSLTATGFHYTIVEGIISWSAATVTLRSQVAMDAADVSNVCCYYASAGLVSRRSPTYFGTELLKSKGVRVASNSITGCSCVCVCVCAAVEGSWGGVASGWRCSGLSWWWRRHACMWAPPMSVPIGSHRMWCGEVRCNGILKKKLYQLAYWRQQQRASLSVTTVRP
jgi:hypothetical protein